MSRKISVIITGVTGMVGEGVLYEALQSTEIERVLVLSRKSCGMKHPKMKELLHADFYDLSTIEQELKGYDACFFCLGISSVGVPKETYYQTTYTLTMSFAKTLCNVQDNMTFIYVSGAGTDSTEKGRSAWARVKGKTENDLMKLPFKQVFAFRPGLIKPTPKLQFTHSFYSYIGWLFPIGRFLYPKGFCTMTELAKAMIAVSQNGYNKTVVDGNDIIKLGQ